jgi:hypothetical protein
MWSTGTGSDVADHLEPEPNDFVTLQLQQS